MKAARPEDPIVAPSITIRDNRSGIGQIHYHNLLPFPQRQFNILQYRIELHYNQNHSFYFSLHIPAREHRTTSPTYNTPTSIPCDTQLRRASTSALKPPKTVHSFPTRRSSDLFALFDRLALNLRLRSFLRPRRPSRRSSLGFRLFRRAGRLLSPSAFSWTGAPRLSHRRPSICTPKPHMLPLLPPRRSLMLLPKPLVRQSGSLLPVARRRRSVVNTLWLPTRVLLGMFAQSLWW